MSTRYRRRAMRINLKDESFQSTIGIILVVFSILAVLSFFGQAAGFGSFLQDYLNRIFGWGAFMFPIVTGLLGLVLLRLKVAENIVRLIQENIWRGKDIKEPLRP